MSDAFYNALCDHQHLEGYEEGYKDGYEAGKREAASPWHRVEEPPKEGQNVLTMDANEDMEMAVYDGKRFFDSYGFYVTDVLYWMPIEPPEEDA